MTTHKEFQTIDFEGKEYTLKQDPYLAGYYSDVYDWYTELHYEALATDSNGKEYLIRWEIARNTELEEDRCDWCDPESVEAM